LLAPKGKNKEKVAFNERGMMLLFFARDSRKRTIHSH